MLYGYSLLTSKPFGTVIPPPVHIPLEIYFCWPSIFILDQPWEADSGLGTHI